MRKLPHTAAEDLLEVIMRRYERASTLITSNRPVEDWGKLLGDTAAVAAFLDRLLHHAHVLTCGPRSWRTRLHGERPSGPRIDDCGPAIPRHPPKPALPRPTPLRVGPAPRRPPASALLRTMAPMR
jgi:hypothetical protein